MSPRKWQVISVMTRTEEDIEYLDQKLLEGWEPFAVTGESSIRQPLVYHLRRELGDPDLD